MEVIDQLIKPPSANHIMLLKYILTVALLLFIPYLCMVMGASAVSLYFNYSGKKLKNNMYLRFAKDVIERLTITKNAELALGIIPVLSVLFSYAQLLYEAKTITIGMMALSAVIFIAAFMLIYRYRTSYRIESVLNAFRKFAGKAAESETEITDFEENVSKTKNTAGKIGVLLLYTAAYLFIGSMRLATDPARWSEINNVLALLFSWTTFSNFMYMLAASGTITGCAILFYFFKWNNGVTAMDEAYSKFVKRFAGALAFISAIILPILLYYNFVYLPQTALSISVFFYMLLALAVILLLCNFLYAVIKNQEVKFVNLVFVLVFLAFLFNIVKDQIAFGNAIKEHTLFISEKAEELEKEKKGKLISTEGISGEEVYRTRCTSCHKFDSRLVGPPHDQVVPKYKGDVNKLMTFILNPIKVDPNFPPMPNPGLKPKEAAAVAQYLIEKVKKDTGK
jgi:cytochrome c